MMIRRAFLPLAALFLAACAPVIKPLEPTMTPTVAKRTPTASPATLPSGTPHVAQVTAARSLNVRQYPGDQARVVGALYSGDQVELTGTCSKKPKGWAQIHWKQSVAWVNAKYLSKNKCSEK